MLTLTFLGVGSAFAKRNFQSNALIEAWSTGPSAQAEPDDTLLIDFGATGPLALHTLRGTPGFAYLDRRGMIYYPAIRRVFITHLHSDHIAGLEELAAMNRYQFADRATDPPASPLSKGGKRGFRPQLIGAAEVIETLWDHSLRGGLSGQRGGTAELQDFFEVVAIRPSHRGGPDRFKMMERYEFSLFPTDHIQIHHKYDWPSFGLCIRDSAGAGSVVYSGDTRFDPDGLGPLMTEAKIIFHDVQLEDHAQPVHALLGEMRTLPGDIRGKTILYHYGDTWDSDAFKSVVTEFAGFAKPHHRYVLFD